MKLLIPKMPVKHKVPEVLEQKCRHFFEERWPDEEPLEINPYKLKVLIGVGQGTSLKLFNDPLYVPDARVMDALCATFDLQPGDFLYYERSSNAQDEPPAKPKPKRSKARRSQSDPPAASSDKN